MKKFRTGRIDISALNVPPEKHEYETAKYFANRGFDVVFIKPRDTKGFNSPDFMMDNKAWETKCPIKYSKRSFEDNLKKASKQSENVIFDLRRLSAKDEIIYARELKNWSTKNQIKNLLVVTRDGQVLTIKGRFAIMVA